MKAEWLVCLSETAFYAELKSLGIQRGLWPKFLQNTHSGATINSFDHEGKRLTIVCMDSGEASKYSGVEIAALLVHEAVHIWQEHARRIGSFNDHGDEEEAYAIQAIAQNLMESYIKQTCPA